MIKRILIKILQPESINNQVNANKSKEKEINRTQPTKDKMELRKIFSTYKQENVAIEVCMPVSLWLHAIKSAIFNKDRRIHGFTNSSNSLALANQVVLYFLNYCLFFRLFACMQTTKKSLQF